MEDILTDQIAEAENRGLYECPSPAFEPQEQPKEEKKEEKKLNNGELNINPKRFTKKHNITGKLARKFWALQGKYSEGDLLWIKDLPMDDWREEYDPRQMRWFLSARNDPRIDVKFDVEEYFKQNFNVSYKDAELLYMQQRENTIKMFLVKAKEELEAIAARRQVLAKEAPAEQEKKTEEVNVQQ